MKEIKFRAKVQFNGNHKFSGEWVYGYYRNNDNGNAFITETLDELDNYIFEETEIDVNTLGQYIGLKDKKGKEIYENDILKVENIDYAKVYYDEDRMAWCLQEIGEWYLDSPLLSDNTNLEFIVVGNIYDSPELLEV